MAEPEKGNSSPGEDSGKMPQLDEDISNDFLTSWKPMSMTGGDDMDFNFEPVTKGNKKAFDFGKLDMDFSLDGEFGKLSSLKLDMPDLDFSGSPQKPKKSKEKSKEESVKGNRPVKKNEFAFSFDFNGLDDFCLDGPPTKGGGHPSREEGCKEVGSENEIEGDNLSRQVAIDNEGPEDIISKRPAPVPEDAPNSKSEVLLNKEGSLDASHRNFPAKSEIVVDLIRPKATQVLSEEICAAQETHHETHMSDETANKSYAQGTVHDFDPIPESKSSSMPVPLEVANTVLPSETKLTKSSERSDLALGTQAIEKNSNQSHAELKAEDSPAIPSLVKTSTQATRSEETDDCSADGTLNCSSSAACIVTGTLPVAVVLASDTEKEKPEKLSQQVLTEKASTSDEKSGLGGVIAYRGARLALSSVDRFAPSVPDTMSSDAQYHAEAPRSTSKYFSTPFGRLSILVFPCRALFIPAAVNAHCSTLHFLVKFYVISVLLDSGSITANTTVTAYKVPGGNNSKFSMPRETSDGGRTKLSLLARKRDDSKLAAEDRRERTESMSGGVRDGVDTDAVPQDGQAMKDRLLLRESGTKINDPKSSRQGIAASPPIMKQISLCSNAISHVPSSVFTEGETKLSNQPHEKFKDKIPSIVPVLKSNSSESNKLYSLKSDKKLSSLPSLRIPVNLTTAKYSASPAVQQNAKFVVNSNERSRFQTMNNLVPSIGAEKERPSTPFLKRKTSEVHARAVQLEGSRRNAVAEHPSPKFDFHQEANMEVLGFTLMAENDANIEKAEACAEELGHICSMLKKKHEEAKELLQTATNAVNA
ncbi:hypothetical protein Cgig2_030532 [Carnegiea gigantea]|uniref:Uncharacterized protein n=1 Tax=Carnegiea gigantea TaxID=171969 RepID=A0A9Q1JN93_9CARY|nr:hypothetical protein Cgig2_030532 [Carnegiea gigantea]